MGSEQMVHTRQIRVESYDIGDGQLLIRGSLEDNRPQPMRLADGEVRPPGVVHGLRLEMVVKCPDFTITSVEASMPNVPQDACREALPTFQALVGQRISPGFTDRTKRLLGGNKSCAHFVSLILAMAPSAIQAYGAILGRREDIISTEGIADRLRYLINTCLVWAEDGPMVQRLRKRLES
ncbi:MAG: DUF2889 domain-containing protein [Chloroflexota bacterium]